VSDEKEKITIDNKPKGEKIVVSGLGKKEGKKKHIKKIIYYDNDTSSQKDDNTSPSKQNMVKTSFNHTPLHYSCISRSSNAQIAIIPLDRPPQFDGEDYSWWSHKMCSHLFSIHPSNWDIVENEFTIPNVHDGDYNEVEVEEQIHRNAQVTTVLLASLYMEEYNKVNGLANVKDIWDTLCIAHKGNLMTKITKMEVIEGELGRIAMKRGEEPQEMYTRLKSLVNQVCNYGSTRWTDHEVVQLMLRSFTIFYANLVSLVRENPKYTKMSPEEVLGKFISHQMMVKNAKYIDDIANGNLIANEPQAVALRRHMTRKRSQEGGAS
jgi:hypothetical protein